MKTAINPQNSSAQTFKIFDETANNLLNTLHKDIVSHAVSEVKKFASVGHTVAKDCVLKAGRELMVKSPELYVEKSYGVPKNLLKDFVLLQQQTLVKHAKEVLARQTH